ncbi:flagellar filament capping protein FliD [Alicyclobacillus tolerans]|uniref:flagellar filament capping protein FliD n=1 Tax=Alicyclobacillus tolerans TaxID=90970 RepID=UPI001EFF79B5|nr:flagellar filament capping protein FliD [Alicyclobacillus tolerans]MCF8567758.1 flagellar filament capping protein FliD [Alicyclobacillus tolerans]
MQLEQSSQYSQYIGNEANKIYQQYINEGLPYVSQIAGLNSQESALKTLQTDLTTLQTAIQTLGTQSTWQGVTASSSNTSALTVTASAGAPQTSIPFYIQSTAQAQVSTVNISNSSADGTTNVVGGTFEIENTTTKKTASIQINTGDSLNTIAQDINQSSQYQALGIQASVTQNNGTYQLMLSSTQSGQSNAFTIDSNSTATSGGTTLALTNITNAQNASIILNPTYSTGAPPSGPTYQSSTNTFNNLIPNTTITVAQAGQSGTISISPDNSTVTEAVKSFFSSYNAVEKLVYTGGDLTNTAIGQEIASQLPGLVNSTASTVTQPVSGNALPNSLSQIGVLLSPGSYSESSSGSFTSGGPPSLDWEQTSGIPGTSLPSGVTMQSGLDTFNNLLSTAPQELQNLLGVSSTGLNLPAGSILQQFSASIKLWQDALSGTGSGSNTITGEINMVQNEIGGTGPSALPGSINYQLNSLNQQYTNQIQNLISQWNAAQSSTLQAQTQLTELQAEMQLTQSSSFQVGMMLGG